MVVSGSNAPAVLEAVEEALDPVSHRIQCAIDCVLDVTVLLGRDFWLATPDANLVANGIAVVALVAQHHRRVGVGLGHQVVERRAVVSLARGQQKRDWKTLSVGPGVDFGRKATARAAKSLVLSPPFAPAAQ